MFLRPTTINACLASIEDRPAPFGEIPAQEGEREFQIGACLSPVGERTAPFRRRRFGRVNNPAPFDFGFAESDFKFLFLVHRLSCRATGHPIVASAAIVGGWTNSMLSDFEVLPWCFTLSNTFFCNDPGHTRIRDLVARRRVIDGQVGALTHQPNEAPCPDSGDVAGHHAFLLLVARRWA